MRISDWSSDVCSSDLERIKDVVARLPLGFGNFAELADLCVRYEISGMRAYFVAGGEIRKEEGAERLLVKNTEVIVLDIAVMRELPIRSLYVGLAAKMELNDPNLF